MDRIKQIENKFFDLGDYDEIAIRAFIKKTVEDQNKMAIGEPRGVRPDLVNQEEAFKFLRDSGTGRIFDGLRSLEMMSRVIRGVPLSSLSLFDAKILFFTPDDMKFANAEMARTIILTNIGVVHFFNAIKDLDNDEVAKYIRFLDKIAKQIKSGGFRTQDNIAEAIQLTKSVVRLALNTRG